MPLFVDSDLRKTAEWVSMEKGGTASSIIKEAAIAADIHDSFDIFLSHSYLDSDLVLGLKTEIEKMGYSVYVDWVEDKHLNRSNVTKKTVHKLKKRMDQCKSLFFATSSNSTYSKWMPWECGYFDGINGRVAICPIVKNENLASQGFKGQEYLGIYNFIQSDRNKSDMKLTLWVYNEKGKYAHFDEWVKGKEPYKPILITLKK